MINVKELDFFNCYNNSVIFEDDGLKVRTINKNHLLFAKNSTGRAKDIDDIENLSE